MKTAKLVKPVEKTYSQKIKDRARKSLNGNFSKQRKNYVIDTSAIINKFIPGLVKKGLKGKIIIPNPVMAELEHLANKGLQEGFTGLDEVAKLHKLKQVKVEFKGPRPNEMQIKFAKSGEIDALIREMSVKNKATLITADLVQAKSAQAYGIDVLFLRPKLRQIELPKKKKFLGFFRKK